MKHFENLWEEAEEVISKANEEKEIYAIDEIQSCVECFWDAETYNRAELEQIMGKLLLHVCLLSKTHNINTYAVLKEAMNDMKVEILDPDIDSDI